MIGSSVRSPGEVESITFKSVLIRKFLLWTDLCTVAIAGRFSALYINQSLTKKFPIETFLEMIDSSVKSPGEFEYDYQNCLT